MCCYTRCTRGFEPTRFGAVASTRPLRGRSAALARQYCPVLYSHPRVLSASRLPCSAATLNHLTAVALQGCVPSPSRCRNPHDTRGRGHGLGREWSGLVFHGFAEPEERLLAVDALVAESAVKDFAELELSDGGSERGGALPRLVRAGVVALSLAQRAEGLKRGDVRAGLRGADQDLGDARAGDRVVLQRGAGGIVVALASSSVRPRAAVRDRAAQGAHAAEGLIHVQVEVDHAKVRLLVQDRGAPLRAHTAQRVRHRRGPRKVPQHLVQQSPEGGRRWTPFGGLHGDPPRVPPRRERPSRRSSALLSGLTERERLTCAA